MSYIIRDETEIAKMDRNRVSVFVAKLYIFCLTFRMIAPLSFLESIIGSAALSFDILPHALGMVLVFIDNRMSISLSENEEGSLLSFFIKMVCWFTISSIIMAFVMQLSYGNLGNENAFRGIIGMILYWTQYAAILFYNYHIFRLLSIKEIERTLKLEMLMLFVIGYFQLTVMTMGGVVSTVYDNINIFGVLNQAGRLPKLCLTGTEGAYAGYIMGTLVFPFLYALSLSGKMKGNLFIYVILWIPLVYMTYSSAAYILFTISTACYLFYHIKINGISKSILLSVCLAMLIILVIAIFRNDIQKILPSDFSRNIQYILIDKLTDSNNGSTASRTVPFYYNWGAFTEYPVLGVGNGLQGYFLTKYFPESAYAAKGIDFIALQRQWTTGISNGALFWPSILSGYGIVGVTLVLLYITKSEKLIRKKNEQMGTMYYMYRLSLAGIIVAGFATEFVAKYYIWFAVSIPLMSVTYDDKINMAHQTKKGLTECKYIRC